MLNRDELEWWQNRSDFNVMFCLSRPRRDNILINLARRMKCGVGKCCRCAIWSNCSFIDGPVFNHVYAMNVPELI
jgi:hypothetical protein